MHDRGWGGGGYHPSMYGRLKADGGYALMGTIMAGECKFM